MDALPLPTTGRVVRHGVNISRRPTAAQITSNRKICKEPFTGGWLTAVHRIYTYWLPYGLTVQSDQESCIRVTQIGGLLKLIMPFKTTETIAVSDQQMLGSVIRMRCRSLFPL